MFFQCQPIEALCYRVEIIFFFSLSSLLVQEHTNLLVQTYFFLLRKGFYDSIAPLLLRKSQHAGKMAQVTGLECNFGGGSGVGFFLFFVFNGYSGQEADASFEL